MSNINGNEFIYYPMTSGIQYKAKEQSSQSTPKHEDKLCDNSTSANIAVNEQEALTQAEEASNSGLCHNATSSSNLAVKEKKDLVQEKEIHKPSSRVEINLKCYNVQAIDEISSTVGFMSLAHII